jgi:hypothetical protein
MNVATTAGGVARNGCVATAHTPLRQLAGKSQKLVEKEKKTLRRRPQAASAAGNRNKTEFITIFCTNFEETTAVRTRTVHRPFAVRARGRR